MEKHYRTWFHFQVEYKSSTSEKSTKNVEITIKNMNPQRALYRNDMRVNMHPR